MRKRLLDEAKNKPPKLVCELDGFRNVIRDDVMHPDEEGDCRMMHWSWELRSTADPDCVAVRIQIAEGTPRADAVRLIRKLSAAWLENDYLGDGPIYDTDHRQPVVVPDVGVDSDGISF
jgi:hypothetical protein